MQTTRHTRNTGAIVALIATIATALGTGPAHAQDVTFVRWTEPTEQAFSLQVPKGWKVAGGLKRAGATDLRESVTVSTPNQDMVVSIGDSSLPTFATLTPMELQVGMREGTVTNEGNYSLLHMHYMTAPEFNRMYLQRTLGTMLNDFKITAEAENKTAAEQLAARLSKGSGIPYTVSAAVAQFSGTDKQTGKKIAGALMSITESMNTSPDMPRTWTAHPMLMAGWDDSKSAARVKTVGAVLQKMQSTWKYDATWSAEENKRIARVTDQAIKDTGGKAKRDFLENQKRRAQQQSQFLDYIRN